MATRSTRRANARTIAAAAKDPNDAQALADALRDRELLKGWCKDYKTKLERLAMGLQLASNFLVQKQVSAALTAIRAMLANDAKEARESVGNRRDALRIAIKAMEVHDQRVEEYGATPPGEDNPCPGDFLDDLKQIKTLCPESFGGEVEMTAPTASATPS